MADQCYKSKAFRNGDMIRMMDYAVRGIPRYYCTHEQRIDVDVARAIYEPEIRLLDELEIHPRWYWSGTIGAALISLVVWPQTIELWRALARGEVYRDEAGVNAAGLLYELVERHQTDERLTRRHDFHYFVFQSAMAVAHAWVYHDREERRYRLLPPVPDVLDLIARVRKAKGLRHTIAGFRPPTSLRGDWFEPKVPELIHNTGMEDVVALAEEAARFVDNPPSQARLGNAVQWLDAQHKPAELRHPAAMAAAVVTIARDPGCRTLWERALMRKGVRRPNPGRKPYSDASMLIQNSIIVANRGKNAHREALTLFYRCVAAVALWRRDAEALWAKLPTASSALLDSTRLWQRQRVAYAPEIKFGCDRPAPTLTPDSEKANAGDWHPERRRSSSTPGKRQQTGALAEEWFMNHYHQIPAFRDSTLVDYRTSGKGFDFLLRYGNQILFVEVKGARTEGDVQMTACQWDRARLEGEDFYLVVIDRIETTVPEPLVIYHPAANLAPKPCETTTTTVNWLINRQQLEQSRRPSSRID